MDPKEIMLYIITIIIIWFLHLDDSNIKNIKVVCMGLVDFKAWKYGKSKNQLETESCEFLKNK